MTVSVGQDAPRAEPREGFSDAVTYAFADPGAELYGVARLGVAEGAASGLALVFRGSEPVAVRADGGVEVDGEGWEALRVAGLKTETVEPLAAWRLRFDGEVALDLTFAADGPAVELAPDDPAARAGGMEGFDHLCRVSGTADGAPIECRGQRGRSWGSPDWDRMQLARTLSVWMDPGPAITAVAVRPAKARHHADEALTAFLAEGDAVQRVADPRISTTYDAEGRQRRAGLELYVGEEDAYPRRAAGEVLAGTTLDLRAPTECGSGLRLHCAFFRWRMDGREGVGRYDVLRRAS